MSPHTFSFTFPFLILRFVYLSRGIQGELGAVNGTIFSGWRCGYSENIIPFALCSSPVCVVHMHSHSRVHYLIKERLEGIFGHLQGRAPEGWKAGTHIFDPADRFDDVSASSHRSDSDLSHR
jgi:hypothetical protein